MTNPTRTTALDIDMSPGTKTRLVAAVRGLFPELTTATSDDAALQNVVMTFCQQWVASWEERQAGPDPHIAADAAAAAAAATRQQARQHAQNDLGADMKPTTPPGPPNGPPGKP